MKVQHCKWKFLLLDVILNQFHSSPTLTTYFSKIYAYAFLLFPSVLEEAFLAKIFMHIFQLSYTLWIWSTLINNKQYSCFPMPFSYLHKQETQSSHADLLCLYLHGRLFICRKYQGCFDFPVRSGNILRGSIVAHKICDFFLVYFHSLIPFSF